MTTREPAQTPPPEPPAGGPQAGLPDPEAVTRAVSDFLDDVFGPPPEHDDD